MGGDVWRFVFALSKFKSTQILSLVLRKFKDSTRRRVGWANLRLIYLTGTMPVYVTPSTGYGRSSFPQMPNVRQIKVTAVFGMLDKSIPLHQTLFTGQGYTVVQHSIGAYNRAVPPFYRGASLCEDPLTATPPPSASAARCYRQRPASLGKQE